METLLEFDVQYLVHYDKQNNSDLKCGSDLTWRKFALAIILSYFEKSRRIYKFYNRLSFLMSSEPAGKEKKSPSLPT